MADSENRDESWEKRCTRKSWRSHLCRSSAGRAAGAYSSKFADFYLPVYTVCFYWFGVVWPQSDMSISGKHTALVELRGVISSDS